MIAYLSNIFIYFKTEKEHIKHINIVLKLLMQKNLLLKSEKCEFHKKKVNFLGFIVGNDTIRMNSAKVRAVKEWETSINSIEVLSFIDFTNYNRKFIEEYFKKAIPLTNLTKKRYIMKMRLGSKENVSATQRRLFRWARFKNVRFEKKYSNKNWRIRLSNRSVYITNAWWDMIFCSILFKEIDVSRTELQYTR